MEHIKQKAEAAVDQLRVKVPQTESARQTTGRHRGRGDYVNAKHIEEIWTRMVMIFGSAWVHEYGERDDGTWLASLRNKTPADIAAGIQATVDSDLRWPPKLPQFKSWCRATPKALHRSYQLTHDPHAGKTPEQRYNHARPFIQTLRSKLA